MWLLSWDDVCGFSRLTLHTVGCSTFLVPVVTPLPHLHALPHWGLSVVVPPLHQTFAWISFVFPWNLGGSCHHSELLDFACLQNYRFGDTTNSCCQHEPCLGTSEPCLQVQCASLPETRKQNAKEALCSKPIQSAQALSLEPMCLSRPLGLWWEGHAGRFLRRQKPIFSLFWWVTPVLISLASGSIAILLQTFSLFLPWLGRKFSESFHSVSF